MTGREKRFFRPVRRQCDNDDKVLRERRYKNTRLKRGGEVMEKVLVAFAAALAIGLTAIATAWAQSRIGSAGAGTIAEKPEMSGTIIILLAIPETMVILGFVIATMILFTVK
jgi:V/A-type H+-transporting ATPase subunit K